MQLPSVGETFQDRYEIRSVLGQGGAGVVYGARDLRSGRDVALKILVPPPEGYDRTTVSRFHREVKIVANLRSPSTVTLYDSGETVAGLLFMACEYIVGRDLEEVIFGGEPLSEAVVGHVLVQLLDALREAHSLGLLHRDVKPANIRIFQHLDDRYRAKLLDFGIARFENPDHTQLTMEGGLVGTPPFMAPEQIRGQALSPATDLYALGLVAYEMLTGRAAVEGASPYEVFERHLRGRPIALPAGLQISAGLRAVVDKMVRRDPDERFQSAAEVLEALGRLDLSPESIPTGESVRGDEPPTLDEAIGPAEPPGTRRAAVFLASLLGLAAVCGGGAFAWFASSDREVPASAPTPAPGATEVLGEGTADEESVEALKVEFAGKHARRALRAALLEATAGAVGGCALAPPPQSVGGTVTVDGEVRRYLVRTPTNGESQRPRPVVLMFPTNATRQPDLGDFARHSEIYGAADRHGFVVVSLLSPAVPMTPNWTNRPMEVRYVRSVVEAIAKTHCVDEQRIYALGHGLGADFLDVAGCRLPVAAIVTNAAIGDPVRRNCEGRPMPHMHLRGRNNRLHPPSGTPANCAGDTTPSLAAFNAPWLKLNECAETWETIELHPAVDCRRAKDCRAPYVVCEHPDGYEWRSTPLEEAFRPECLRPAMSFDGAEVAWRFFEQQTKSDR